MMRATVSSSFETRLGPQPMRVPQADEIYENGDEFVEVKSNPVLIVVDANKEISTNALDWAVSYVVQKGDFVKLLGVLQHILNPSKFVDAWIFYRN